MKKILILLLCFLCLTGCKKKVEEEPVVTYDYDLMDYINLNYIGPDGYAELDITVKDFTAKDFKTEEDYIKMKKLIAAVYPHMIATKQENLTNGDVIQVGVSSSFDTKQIGDLSIDLNVKEIEINNLPSPKILYLFDENNVVFYGLANTSKVYYYFPSSTSLTKEMQENLIYDIQIDDQTVQKDKTVLSLKAGLDSNLLESSEKYGTDYRYFGSQGYIVELEDEKILKYVVQESALANADKKIIRESLEPKIKEIGVDGYDFQQIMTIQKTKTPFKYYVVAKYSKETKDLYIKYSVSMAYVNNELAVYSLNRESTTDIAFTIKAYEDCEIIHSYEVFEIVDDTPQEEIVTEE